MDSGFYVPLTAKKVTHWPEADADGDGEDVYEDRFGPNGESMGRFAVKDSAGKPVRAYEAPEGFRNFPSYDNTHNYVKVDERGRVWRHPRTGEACSIKPGQTLVEHPNGDFEYLEDDYQRYLFQQAHERSKDAVSSAGSLDTYQSDAQKAAEQAERDREEFEAWKAAKAADAGKDES